MNQFDSVPLPYAGTGAAAAERVTAFLRAVCGWMFAGLTVTAVVAWLVAGTPSPRPGITCATLSPGLGGP